MQYKWKQQSAVIVFTSISSNVFLKKITRKTLWTEPLVTQWMLLRSKYQQPSCCCFPDLEMLKEKCFHPLEVVKGAEKYVVLLFSHPWWSDKYTERFQRQNLSSIQDKRLQIDCQGESIHVTMQYPPISSQKLKLCCKGQSNNTSGKY